MARWVRGNKVVETRGREMEMDREMKTYEDVFDEGDGGDGALCG